MAERITIREREADPGQQWKCGDEFLPFHPQASHVPPEYRDGWNRCYWMAVNRVASPAQPMTPEHAQQAFGHVGGTVVRVGEHNGGDYDMTHRTAGVPESASVLQWVGELPAAGVPGTHNGQQGNGNG